MYTLQVVVFDIDLHMPTIHAMRNILKVWIALESECYDNYVKLSPLVVWAKITRINMRHVKTKLKSNI